MKYSYLFDTDAYKTSHWLQYPDRATSMFSYIEARGSDEFDCSVFFGLQYYLKEYLIHRVTEKEVERAKVLCAGMGIPFNYDGWMYIARDLKGKLPVRIRAVPEGTVMPLSNIMVSIESTDEKVFWIVSWLETMILRLWHPITVATKSYLNRKIIFESLQRTSDNPESEIDFKLHDFGSRGSHAQEAAAIGGAAHLLSFKGSDTIVGVMCANEHYDCEMAGFSIPAAEHSSITSFGKDNEVEAYRNMLKQFAKPGSVVAVVSDSYDIFNAISNLWGTELKQEVINSGATVVIRPDSGVPWEIVPQCLKLLDEKFGHAVNGKGFKVLNNVKVIQGDGINHESIKKIIAAVENSGYSLTNVAFGQGGALLAQHHRDTMKFAMKCSSITVDGKEVDVFKSPVTDTVKKSKKGRLDLISKNGNYITVKLDGGQLQHPDSVMQTVYENGEILVDLKFEEIRFKLLNE